MTDTEPLCGHPDCGVPVAGTTLCRDHQAILLELVDAVPWLLDELRTAETRQVRVSRSKGGGGERSPLLFNDRARVQREILGKVLLAWQGRLADWCGQPVRFTSPVAASYWIAEQLQQHRRTTSYNLAGQFLAELEHEHTTTLLVLNPAADQWFAGRCNHDRGEHTPDGCHCACHQGGACPLGHDCAEEWERQCPRGLYADNATGTITCPLCGATHDVAARRASLLRQARTFALTTTEIALAVTTWGDYDVTETRLRNRIKKWSERLRITQAGTLEEGGRRRPTYRLGAVLDLLDVDLERRRETARKRALVT